MKYPKPKELLPNNKCGHSIVIYYGEEWDAPILKQQFIRDHIKNLVLDWKAAKILHEWLGKALDAREKQKKSKGRK